MNDQSIVLWAQVIATLFVGSTFIVNYFQLRTMNKASEAQSVLSLISFLNTSGNHLARKHVLSTLREKKYEDWDETDKAAASKVCSSYDTAGLLIRDGTVKGTPILTNWGPSILHCFMILSPFITDLRKNMGNQYWDDFEWMHNQIKDGRT